MLQCNDHCGYAFTKKKKIVVFYSKLIWSSDFYAAGVRPEIFNNLSDFF